MQFLWFLLIGLVAGWLAGLVVKGSGFGIIGDIIVGIVGAIFGGWLFSALGFSFGGDLGGLITATLGAIVLILLIRLIKRV